MASIEPLMNPYLWVLGPAAQQFSPGSTVGNASAMNRYQVIAPQVWLDTQPGELPSKDCDSIHPELLPYQYLHPLRLHVPMVYGICGTPQGTVVLLENSPLEGSGRLLPRLDQNLSQATPLRQLNWLWQTWELWTDLSRWGVAASLLVPDNLRVQGSIVRLRELYGGLGEDPPLGTGLDLPQIRYATNATLLPSVRTLGELWQGWIPAFAEHLQSPLMGICQELQQGTPPTSESAITKLNRLLLRETARSPLKLAVVGQTHPGQAQPHNEDRCFPLPSDLAEPTLGQHGDLVPHVVLVCDGTGGHEGGEVASQLALRSMKLQVQALFQDLQHQAEGDVLPPAVIREQLAASVRVVNNLITAQNDLQHRSDRQRMATTLVMVVHVQQGLKAQNQTKIYSHEMYVVHLGDSRAYWMTQNTCHRLTVDDDVASREVRMGRLLYRMALEREDAQSLTQALGTRTGDALHVHIQRFIVDEDGVFFLCSDGLSDRGWVDRYWNGSIASLLSEMQSLGDIAQEWIDLGNQKNGQDNISVGLLKCRISPDYGILLDPFPDGSIKIPQEVLADNEVDHPATPELVTELSIAPEPLDPLTAASAALMEETAELQQPHSSRKKWLAVAIGLSGLALLSVVGAIFFLLPNSATFREILRDRLSPGEPIEQSPQQPSP
jgi:protein phosphatase